MLKNVRLINNYGALRVCAFWGHVTLTFYILLCQISITFHSCVARAINPGRRYVNFLISDILFAQVFAATVRVAIFCWAWKSYSHPIVNYRILRASVVLRGFVHFHTGKVCHTCVTSLCKNLNFRRLAMPALLLQRILYPSFVLFLCSFFFLFPLKFALASLLWKQARSKWTLTRCEKCLKSRSITFSVTWPTQGRREGG